MVDRAVLGSDGQEPEVADPVEAGRDGGILRRERRDKRNASKASAAPGIRAIQILLKLEKGILSASPAAT